MTRGEGENPNRYRTRYRYRIYASPYIFFEYEYDNDNEYDLGIIESRLLVSSSRLLLPNTILLQHAVQGDAVDTQNLGGFSFMPVCLVQNLEQAFSGFFFHE